MFQVHVILPENRMLYQSQLEDMFRQRYEVFVNRLKWDLPDADHINHLEIDAYDKPDTIYLLVLRDGMVVGASRMIPTTGQTMMGDLFPELCPNGLPTGTSIWEWSRAHAKPDEPHQIRSNVINHIFLSGYEFAYKARIAGLTAQVNAREMDRWLGRGLVVDVLGPPHAYNHGEDILALQHHISAAALVRVRQETGLADPVLRLVQIPGQISLDQLEKQASEGADEFLLPGRLASSTGPAT